MATVIASAIVIVKVIIQKYTKTHKNVLRKSFVKRTEKVHKSKTVYPPPLKCVFEAQ